MIKLVYITFFNCLFANAAFAAVDTINRIDASGERFGYWVIDASNNPISINSKDKYKEGTYKKGRKEGTWICYHKDGQTPRLIGEYQDNRPSGVYFRFDFKGKLIQASSVPRNINKAQVVDSKNDIFSCRLMFHNFEMVAGQVFFEKKAFKTPYSLQIWTEQTLRENKVYTTQEDYTWLDQNYSNLFTKYLNCRIPQNFKIQNEEIQKVVDKVNQTQIATTETVENKNAVLAPYVTNPRVAKGLRFQMNGFNKLYTETNEIWIDGLFQNGQLKDGKVFVYDRDGVLLRVRIFKEGKYVSDGGI